MSRERTLPHEFGGGSPTFQMCARVRFGKGTQDSTKRVRFIRCDAGARSRASP